MNTEIHRSINIEKLIRFALWMPMGDPLEHDCIWGLPLYMTGGSGISKSRKIRAVAESAGFHFPPPIYPSQRTPDDFGGIVTPSGAIVCLIKAIREAAAVFEEKGKRSVIFMDEFTGAEESVQNAALSTLWERFAGDVAIPPPTRILLAANPVDKAAGGHALRPPTANRLVHVSYPKPTESGWKSWKPWESHGGVKAPQMAKEIDWARWPLHLMTIKLRLDCFFDAHESFLYRQPDELDEKSEGAWPSPRTWEFVMRILTLQDLLTADGQTGLRLGGDEVDALFEGSVGREAFAAYKTWIRSVMEGIPGPEQLLANGWAFNPARPDIGRYVIQSVSSNLKSRDAGRFLDLMTKASSAGLDDAVVPALADMLTWHPLSVMEETTRQKSLVLLKQLRNSPLGETYLPP